MIQENVLRNLAVMGSEPLDEISAEEWRNILESECSDGELATALAGAWNKAIWLGHDLDDDDCSPEKEQLYQEWNDLEQAIMQSISLRFQCEITPPYLSALTPFMEKNGFYNNGGWWVRSTSL